MRLTRRDLVVAALTAVATTAIVLHGRAESPVLGSTAFAWEGFTARPTNVGEVRQVVRQPTATLDELEIHITTLNPGQTPHPPHQHPDEEVLCVKEGTVESLVNGETRRVGPGSVIFQAANQLHGLRNVGTTPATYFVIKWNSPGMLKARGAADK